VFKSLKLHIVLISIALNAVFTNLHAQDDKNSIEVSPFMGISMFSIDPYKMKGEFYGGEALYHLNMARNKADWVQKLKVKNITFAASYQYLDKVYFTRQPGSEGIIGNTFGISSRLGIELTQFGKTSLMFYPGFGFAYATESYYTNGNPLIGSAINFSITAGLKFSTPLGTNNRLTYGLDIYHYSNAAVRLPNDGVNSFNLLFGIDHDINTPGPQTSKGSTTSYNQNAFEFGVNIGKRGLVQSGAGLTGQGAEDQKTATSHLVNSGFYAGYNYRVSPVFSLKANTDAVLYATTFDYNNFYRTFQERGSSFDRWRVGAGLGFDVWLGKVAFEANYGHYIHYASYYPEHWYWTFGGKLYLNQWLAIEAKQYLHGTEANFAGFGFLIAVK
jgi:hypothetical protein